MPKYCPVCFGEYKDTVKICPKDNATLSDKKIPSSDRLIDIYAASNEIEQECIVDLLQHEGIIAQPEQSGMSQLPTLSDNRFIVAVQRGSIKQAKILIERAQKDGIISPNGIFL